MENQKVPLYVAIYEELRNQIINGEYSMGDEFPSEKILQDKYGVSRITIRNATERLSNEGLIDKKSGKKTTVSNTKEIVRLKATTGFSHDNKEQGVYSKLISFEIIEGSFDICQFLGLNLNELVYQIARERYVNDNLVTLQVAYIPVKLIDISQADFMNEKSSLFNLFYKNGIIPKRADELYSVINADELVSQILQVEDESPLLFIERTTFDENNRAIEFVENYYQTDRFKYSVSFGEE